MSQVPAPTSQLTDQFGRAFTRAEIHGLQDEVSAIDSMQGRAPFAGHLAFGMDPQRLGSVVRAADAGNSLDWLILAEEIEELYPHYHSVLSKRKRQVSQLPIKVEAAGEDAEARRHADFVQDWLDTDVLQNALFNVLDALGKGFSVHEIIWETSPGRVRPAEMLYRYPRFFEFSWWDGDTIWLRTQAGFADLAPHKFLVHRHPAKSGQTIRSGLTRIIAFLWMFSAFTLKDWAIFCQAYGFPIRVGRYGPEASDIDKRVLWQAVSSIAGDVAATIPRSMEIEFIKDSDRVAGSTLYEKRADWMDRTVSKVVLGGTAGTDAIHGGHAVGKEHRSAEQDVERFDARLLGVAFSRQLVMPMVAFTFGEQARYPRIVVGQEEKAPLADVISAVADLGGMGLKVKASEIRDRLDLTVPEAGDEVVGGVPPAPAPQPDIPRPAVRPPITQAQQPVFGPLRELVLRHAEMPEEIVEAMSERLARDAAGALAGMTADVRAEFDTAVDMEDLAKRLGALSLPREQYAHAMARGMALAQLVGQASVVAELGRSGGV